MQWGKEGEAKMSLWIPGLGKVEELERAQRQTDHVDHEEAVLFICWFSSSKSPSQTRANRVLRGFTSPSPFLFLRLSSGDQLPGSLAGLSKQKSSYCPEK